MEQPILRPLYASHFLLISDLHAQEHDLPAHIAGQYNFMHPLGERREDLIAFFPWSASSTDPSSWHVLLAYSSLSSLALALSAFSSPQTAEGRASRDSHMLSHLRSPEAQYTFHSNGFQLVFDISDSDLERSTREILADQQGLALAQKLAELGNVWSERMRDFAQLVGEDPLLWEAELGGMLTARQGAY